MAEQWTAALLKEMLDREQKLRDDFARERDRRYAEVDVEREKALRIKDEGDKVARAIKDESDKEAMRLAREIQIYKDEKANELREQINTERGLYATRKDLAAQMEKIEAMIRPLVDYVARNQGKGSGIAAVWGWVLGAAGLIAIVVTLLTQWKG